MITRFGWSLSALVLLLLLLVGCAIEGQAPEYSGLREAPALIEEMESNSISEPLSPVMQDVYDQSIPEDVYSIE